MHSIDKKVQRNLLSFRKKLSYLVPVPIKPIFFFKFGHLIRPF
jgi:hypothetical protein